MIQTIDADTRTSSQLSTDHFNQLERARKGRVESAYGMKEAGRSTTLCIVRRNVDDVDTLKQSARISSTHNNQPRTNALESRALSACERKEADLSTSSVGLNEELDECSSVDVRRYDECSLTSERR